MKLSNRLQAIAALVPISYGVADVGCDHGKILLYVLKNQLTNYVIASDISEPSLQKAHTLLTLNNYNNFKTIVSDGLKSYSASDVESIETFVVSGMGGLQIINIIAYALKSHNIVNKKFILQPQNNVVMVRQFLNDNNFYIFTDTMVNEKDKYYNIIVCQLKKTKQKLSKKQFEFGLTNLKIASLSFINYLNYEIDKTKNIINQTKHKTQKQHKKRLKMLNSVLKKVKHK